MFTLLIHVKIEKIEMMNMIKLQILIMYDNILFCTKKFNMQVINTIIKKNIFMYQTCVYHLIKFFSSSLSGESDFILFFTNGAKNITHAIEESLASEEMMLLFPVSIMNISIFYKFFFLISVVISSFSVGDAMIFIAICWFPAKINHSQIPHEISFCCSASDSPKS